MATKGALAKSPKTGGRVYAGGSPNFDESKGRYTSPPRGSERLSPGVYRTPSGTLMSGQGRPLPSTGAQRGQGLADSMDGMRNLPGRVPSGNVPNRPMGPPLRQDLSQRMPPGYDQSMLGAITGANNAGANVFGPKGPAPMDMQRPFMNQPAFPQQNPGMAQAAGQAAANYNPYQYAKPQNLGLSQLSNMSGDQLPQYLNQMRQAQQAQQMQPPQMNMPMPELSLEQWKQMRMGQQMPQQQYGQPQNMDPNGMAIGPGGQQMTVQQLEQMKAQNPNRFGSIS